jgi:coenzyme F420-reducing hydrogenase delta subunit/formate hydrogenlyase subunit 6/NADH:ubiquinone oxidoreductase subunit I
MFKPFTRIDGRDDLRPLEMEVNRPDRRFEQEVLAEPGGEHLYRCYSCGTCASACLVRRVNPDFNPRLILRMVMLDMRQKVLASPVVWLCSACDLCYSLCPQQIHISELMTAIRNIAIREGYEPPGPTAIVDEELCSGCGMCATACPYEGIKLVPRPTSGNGHMVAQVDKFRCMACGICAATCPSEAIRVEAFSREKVAVRMHAGGWLRSDIEPKIVLFICNWCLRAQADLIRLDQFPSHIRVVNVPCTGQLDPSLVLAPLTEGADGVLVVGCQPGECHYQRGNLLAQRRTLEIKPFLDTLGIGSERLRIEWIATSERRKIERTVQEFTETIEQLGPSPLNGAR